MEAKTIEKKILTPKEVAEYLGTDLRTVYRKIKKGQIPAMKLGLRFIRIKKEDLDSLFMVRKN
jgi:excisionase family DNA binding protein